MTLGFVDTSCLIAVILREPQGQAVRRRIAHYDELLASNLLEAELRSVLRRNGLEADSPILRRLTWVTPHRPLSPEISRVLTTGYVRGADCWHLATALYIAENPEDITFLTLDERQRHVAGALGFRT